MSCLPPFLLLPASYFGDNGEIPPSRDALFIKYVGLITITFSLPGDHQPREMALAEHSSFLLAGISAIPPTFPAFESISSILIHVHRHQTAFCFECQWANFERHNLAVRYGYTSITSLLLERRASFLIPPFIRCNIKPALPRLRCSHHTCQTSGHW